MPLSTGSIDDGAEVDGADGSKWCHPADLVGRARNSSRLEARILESKVREGELSER